MSLPLPVSYLFVLPFATPVGAVVFLLPRLIPDFDPFGQALDTVVPWAINLLLRLAGHDIGGADVHL